MKINLLHKPVKFFLSKVYKPQFQIFNKNHLPQVWLKSKIVSYQFVESGENFHPVIELFLSFKDSVRLQTLGQRLGSLDVWRVLTKSKQNFILNPKKLSKHDENALKTFQPTGKQWQVIANLYKAVFLVN